MEQAASPPTRPAAGGGDQGLPGHSSYQAVMDSAPLPLLILAYLAAASHHNHQGGPQSLHGYSTDIECYERVAVGKKLNQSELGASFSINTVRQCEQECERAKCYAFSFGISHTGNGTCQLASKMPGSDSTINDIEYDLFYKNMACINRLLWVNQESGLWLNGPPPRDDLSPDPLQEEEEGPRGSQCGLGRYVGTSQCSGHSPPPPMDPLAALLPLAILGTVRGHFHDSPRVIIVQDAPGHACYKRMAIGRTLIDKLVRRSLLCDSLRACEEACQSERAFQCEGFNFKFDPNGVDNKCQMTDVKSHNLDLTRDFNPDVDFDFYDRDLNGPRQCFRGPEFDQGQPGGIPPSGGYPGSAPGDPGYPGLDEEPPGPAYPPGGGGPPPPPHGYPRPGGRYPEEPPGNALAPYPPPPRPDRHEYGGGAAYPLGGGLPDGMHYITGEAGTPNTSDCLPNQKDPCFLRSRTGFRLDRRVVLVSLSVPSLYDCESMCVNERKFKCNLFSFRYSVNPSVPNHNCHLGEKPYSELDSYQDIQPDRDFDIYERNPTGMQGCQPKKSWGSECFERVRSGLKLNKNMVKFALKCTSLKECEYACINMPYFTCRAFSFRYGPPVIGDGEQNCLLTDWPIPEMNAGKHLSEDPECELYHRGSYGHGCEIDRYPNRGQLPGGPGFPGGSDRPGFSGGPDRPGFPGGPDRPGFPGGPDRPGFPGGPDRPGFPGSPDRPGYPNGPGRPGEPGGSVGRPLPRPDDNYPGNEIPSTYHPPDKPSQGYYPQKPSGYLPPPPHQTPGYLPPRHPSYPPGGQDYPPVKPGGNLYPPKHDGGYLPPPRKPDGYLPPPPPRKPDSYLPPPRKPDGYLPPPRKPEGYLPPNRPDYPYKPESSCCPLTPPGQNGYLPPKPYTGDYPRPQGAPGYGPDYGYGQDDRRPGETYLPAGSYGVSPHGRPRPSDQLCYIRYSNPARLLPQSIKNSLWVPGEVECKEECTRARDKTKFRCATLSYRDGQCELSDVEQRDLRPGYDYLHDNNDFWMFTWDFGSPGCYKPPPPGKTPLLSNHYPGDRGVEDTWLRFTVNGQPCIPGSVCTQNKDIGVWTCPVASGDWDYCCRAGHQCGFSEGYEYPWCYVGDADKEQWRPCSETYLPYPHSGRKTHWPVAYLHREAPPNVTLSHKPSIVESFLKSLEKSGLSSPIPPTQGQKEDEEGAMDKLLKWGKTALGNLTSTIAATSTTLTTAADTTLASSPAPTTNADANVTETQQTATTTS